MAGSEAQDASCASALVSAMANLDVKPEGGDRGEELAKAEERDCEGDLESQRTTQAVEATSGEDPTNVIVEKEAESSHGISKEEEDAVAADAEEEDYKIEDGGSVDDKEVDGGSAVGSNDNKEEDSCDAGKDGDDRDLAKPSLEDSEAVSDPKDVLKTEGKPSGDAHIVMNAATLMEKLNIAESSDGGSNGGDDDLSSSVDSTANSGPRLVEGEGEGASQEDKLASSEDCSEEGSVRPKKRIDLQHQFVRGIVKIQYDRDQYEKQCQTKKQEVRDVKTPDKSKPDTSARRTSSSHTSPRSPPVQPSKRQFSFVDSPPMRANFKAAEDQQIDKSKHDRSAAIYRPPSLRNADTDTTRSQRSHETDGGRSVRNAEVDTSQFPRHTEADTTRITAASSRSNVAKAGSPAPLVKPSGHSKELDRETLPEDVGIRVTFDTEKQKRRIQLSKPSGSQGKDENNFIVTFDTTRKERHIEMPSSARGKSSNHDPSSGVEVKDRMFGDGLKRRDSSDLPASFEFKATAFGKGPSDETRADGDNPFGKRSGRGSNNKSSRGFRASGNVRMFEVGATPRHARSGNGNGAVNILQVNSKRNEEIPLPLPPKDKPFAAELKWGDMVESEPEPSPTPNAEDSFSSSPAPDVLESNQWHNNGQSSSSGGRKSSSRKHRQKKEWRSSPPPRQPQIESPAPDSQNAPRRSVWERLGPRPVVEAPRLRMAHYENNAMANSLESFREAAERDYLESHGYSEPSEQAVQAAYKDTKQKRSRLELYVPRRGGSQA